MRLRRILPGFLIGAGVLALACWLLGMALVWIRVPLLLPGPSDPWVVQAGVAALLLAGVALVTGAWLVGRAGRAPQVVPEGVQPVLEDHAVERQVEGPRLPRKAGTGADGQATTDHQENER